MARHHNQRQLKDADGNAAALRLGEVLLLGDKPRPVSALSSAQDAAGSLQSMASRVPHTVFLLDYDGTLTPIVQRPELATLDSARRDVLAKLAERHTVAVVSGRGLEDVRSLVGLDVIFYVGSHGLEVAGPRGEPVSLARGSEFESRMDELEKDVRRLVDEYVGVIIERKRLTVAVHFRLASPETESAVAEAVARAVREHPGLRSQQGKKVIEILPDIGWDKGLAVDWLLQKLKIDIGGNLVIYIGDDVTDEDAFRALQGRGLGIVVRDPDPDSGCGRGPDAKETFADLFLEDTDEVYAFLERFCEDEGDSAEGGGERG